MPRLTDPVPPGAVAERYRARLAAEALTPARCCPACEGPAGLAVEHDYCPACVEAMEDSAANAQEARMEYHPAC